VVDAAIVVLENIDRLRHRKNADMDTSAETAVTGTQQVWAALLASTATTVAIFVPVIFLKDVEGQLFADLALTIAISVVMSLLVATTVLPVAARLFVHHSSANVTAANSQRLQSLVEGIMKLSDDNRRRIILIVLLMGVPIALSILLIPKLDYLPPVKRDALQVFLNMPPGANLDFVEDEVVQVVMDRLQPHLLGEAQPALKNYYVLAFGPWGASMGVRPLEQSQVFELQRVLRESITQNLPDAQAYVAQSNLFGNFNSDSDVILLIQSRNDSLRIAAGREAMALIAKAIPGSQARPDPPWYPLIKPLWKPA